MYLGKKVLIKHNGQICKGVVIKIYTEDLDIQLSDEIVVRRKFWEVRNVLPKEK